MKDVSITIVGGMIENHQKHENKIISYYSPNLCVCVIWSKYSVGVETDLSLSVDTHTKFLIGKNNRLIKV